MNTPIPNETLVGLLEKADAATEGLSSDVWTYDGHGMLWGGSLKGGQTHVIDIRGWGYLTGGGHGALNLEGAEAKRIQDARGVFLEALNPSVAKSLILRLQEVEDAIGDFVQATEDFRLFESTYPNDSTKRWDRVFEAKNDAYDRLAAILSAKGA